MDEFVDVSNPEHRFMFMMFERIVDLETTVAEQARTIKTLSDERKKSESIVVYHQNRGLVVSVMFEATELFDRTEGPRNIATKFREKYPTMCVGDMRWSPVKRTDVPGWDERDLLEFGIVWNRNNVSFVDPLFYAEEILALCPFKPVRVSAYAATSRFQLENSHAI